MTFSYAGYSQGPAPNTKFATDKRAQGSDGDVHFQKITPWHAGTWGYDAGVTGQATIPTGGRLLSLAAIAGPEGGTCIINSGDAIPIPANYSIDIEIESDLINADVDFTGTVSYIIQYVV